MEEINASDTPKQTSPPVMLRVLCVLTFVGSSFGCLSYGIIGLMHGYFQANLNLIPDDQNRELIAILLSGGHIYFALSSLLYAISFAGAIYMWKMRKRGFHLYTSAQMLLLILPMAMIKSFPMPGATIFVTIAFIWFYSRFLKEMH